MLTMKGLTTPGLLYDISATATADYSMATGWTGGFERYEFASPDGALRARLPEVFDYGERFDDPMERCGDIQGRSKP